MRNRMWAWLTNLQINLLGTIHPHSPGLARERRAREMAGLVGSMGTKLVQKQVEGQVKEATKGLGQPPPREFRLGGTGGSPPPHPNTHTL